MAETGNIEQLAEKISEDIFEWFKWEQSSPRNVNWKCEREEHDKNTHPSDTVFHYIEPYSGRRVFFNTDLKSYAKNTIKASAIKNAIESLGLSVDCAEISSEWEDYYGINDEYSYDVVGLLFIYNHDNEFHDFKSLLSSVSIKKAFYTRRKTNLCVGP